MKELYVFYFDYKKKEVVRNSVGVEEKPNTLRAACFLPVCYLTTLKKSDIDNVSMVRRYKVYVSYSDDMKPAIRAFRAYFGEKSKQLKEEAEKYDDFYRNCFRYHDDAGSVYVS